jgi:hypothetical protein
MIMERNYWSRDFKLGRESSEHAPGAGASKTGVTKENIDLVHDRSVTVRFIAERCGFCIGRYCGKNVAR